MSVGKHKAKLGQFMTSFAQEWEDATYGKGETQSCYNAFFQVLG